MGKRGFFQLSLALAILAYIAPLKADELRIRTDRSRELSTWKPAIANYSKRHYGEYTWELQPSCIVLHYTVTNVFPWNLVDSNNFAGETPGLAVHYVVDGQQIWEVLPPNVRSRGCYGINHRAINIEMVALDADDLQRRRQTLITTAKLVAKLQKDLDIPKTRLYSHQDVSFMDPSKTPEVKDLIDGTRYHKIDPGIKNMEFIRKRLKELKRVR